MDENNYFETLNNELPEGVTYDVFSENDTSKQIKTETANREYLNVIYKDGIGLEDAAIRMTRSQYIEQHNAIEKTYQDEKQNCKKLGGVVAVIAVIGVLGTIYFHSLAQNIAGMIGTMLCSFFLNLWASASAIVIIVFIITIIKKIKKMKKAYNAAHDRLEQRKHEMMILGQYDASR